MAYQVIIKPSVQKVIRKLERGIQRKVIRLLEALADNPRPAGVTKLAGDDNLWRVRIGDYRVLYQIHDQRLVVLVLKVGHRRDISR